MVVTMDLNAIGIDSSQLLTEDVVGRSDSTGVLRQCWRQWMAYKLTKD